MSNHEGHISIEKAMELAHKGQFLDANEQTQVLETLFKFECWTSWFELMKVQLKETEGDVLFLYIKTIRTCIFYLEDIDEAAKYVKQLLQRQTLTFSDFRKIVLDKVLESQDFRTEGALLSRVWDFFKNREDQIACVERLCFVFEKKSHNESLLKEFYDRLRKMSPENPKALRYFRNLYSQSQDWPAVVDILKILIRSSKHRQEVFRYAQELASVYLYQMNECEQAIRYIEEYCSGSTLDTSTIHYEAYYRLGKLDGCLKVLTGALKVVEDQETQAIIYYRMACIYEQLGQFKQAYEFFQKTFETQDNFLEAIEGLIAVSIKLKEWKSVRDWLHVLSGKANSSSLVMQLRAGIQRLDEGISHAVSP